MTPNAVLPTVAVRPGWPKLATLNRLNTSTRSCTPRRARQADVLDDRRSVSLNAGPTIALRGRLPKWNTPLGDTGSANTELELHEPAAGAAMRGSQTLLLNHWFDRADDRRVADQVGPQRRRRR